MNLRCFDKSFNEPCVVNKSRYSENCQKFDSVEWLSVDESNVLPM